MEGFLVKRVLVFVMAVLFIAALLPLGQSFAYTFPILGDANGDGKITSSDASALLRMTVGSAEFVEGNYVDCDLSGMIAANDASCILRYVVGLQDFIVPGELMYQGNPLDLDWTVTYDNSVSYDFRQATFSNTNCDAVLTLNDGLTDPVFRNAGTYSYFITLEHPDFIIPGQADGTLTIEKATYDMSGISFKDSLQYRDDDSSEDTIERHVITISGTLPEGVSVAYYCNGEEFQYASAVGKYVIVAKFTGDYANYHEIPDMTAVLEIRSRWTGGWMSVD